MIIHTKKKKKNPKTVPLLNGKEIAHSHYQYLHSSGTRKTEAGHGLPAAAVAHLMEHCSMDALAWGSLVQDLLDPKGQGTLCSPYEVACVNVLPKKK